MQLIAWVGQHAGQLGAEHALQRLCKAFTDLSGGGQFPSGFGLIVLVDVALGEQIEATLWIGHQGRRHPPGPDRRADQMHRVCPLGQPFAEKLPVKMMQDQALGAPCSRGNQVDILRLQAVSPQVA